MEEPSSDPILLSTPTRKADSSPQAHSDTDNIVRPSSIADSPLTLDESASRHSPAIQPGDDPAMTVVCASPAEREQPFFVDVPHLSKEQQARYEPDFAKCPMPPGGEFADEEPGDILGEYNIDGALYFFVKLPDGMYHKFPAATFKPAYPEVVERYEQAKEAGSLDPLDLSGSHIHSSSRISLSFKVPKRSKKPLTEPESSSADELAMGFDSDQSETPGVRRSIRAAAAGANKRITKALPYSPKKTRAQGRAIVIADSDADSDIREIVVPTRRSTRVKKTIRSNLKDGDYEAESQDDDSDEFDLDGGHTRAKPKLKKKPKRGRASRPAYGRFRVIADMEIDEEIDEDSDVLRVHRRTCEKCHRLPTHWAIEAAKKKPSRRKKKGSDEEPSENEPDQLEALGGWVRCLKCPVAAHWSCLAKIQRDEILKAAFERDKAEWQAARDEFVAEGRVFTLLEPGKRTELTPWQTTDFICTSCTKGGVCMTCREVVVESEEVNVEKQDVLASTVSMDGVEMADGTAQVSSKDSSPQRKANESESTELAFRCITCKRLAHYAHLPIPSDWDYDSEDVTAAMLAEHYQSSANWDCGDCISFVYTVDHILAWRPYPEDAVEPLRPAGEPVNYKSMLPREYLIKWADRSYKRVSWVSHGWLLATSASKLKNFLAGGTKVRLLPEPVGEDKVEEFAVSQAADFELGKEELPDGASKEDTPTTSVLSPNPDAQRKIPPAWRRVARVLDVLLWHPEGRLASKKKRRARHKTKGKRKVDTDGEDELDDDPRSAQTRRELDAAYDLGEQPSHDLTETVEEYKKRTRCELTLDDIDRVVWGFFKWDDLGYEDASWDSPPRQGSAAYNAFRTAFDRYLTARTVTVPAKRGQGYNIFDKHRARNAWRNQYAFTHERQPDNGQDPQLMLMPFQVDGLNWLCDNWWNHQSCILADEMGLGKTVQMASFIGHVVSKHSAVPILVVVPNSTITNWVREFERWAPQLRVVPFYGEAKAREIIKKYELFHPKEAYDPKETTGAKYHVLITTYEMITNPKEFTPVFKNTPRWEVLVVDEGQRLKSDASLIFKKLKDLNTVHRVIMTGTPLNNNIRELFNLMNFLDPDEWADLAGLAKQYEELTEDNVKELHTRLKPYFLRRIKSEVLELPPKNEVIVPVSMTALQREVYRSILSQNLVVLKNLVAGSMGARVDAAISRANMNNMLMQLRKCLQHPYLVSDEIEPKGLSREETHAKLIDASSKLGLLKTLLPKLRERGHRVLLFSQFSIALDVIEDFLLGEGIKYLRLDGNTKQADRQKGMDKFNKPDSDVFMYILTTRAGGVGINLWTADTVIIFDPDFNPHQDLQAISRAHRYGQKKTCLVFKLMVKGSAEDKIVQTGKKKLVLDHLIVQKMDDADGSKGDMQSILMFGAQALFEEGNDAEDRQIHYSEHDIEKLVERTEKEGDQVESESSANAAFSFAKIWSADKDELDEVQDDPTGDQVDSWALTLERIAAERTKVQTTEITGRGARRKAAAVFPQQQVDLADPDPPVQDVKTGKGKGKKKSKSHISDDSDVYAAPGSASDSGSGSGRSSVVSDDLLHDLLNDKAGHLSSALHLSSPPVIQPSALASCAPFQSHAYVDNVSQPLSPIQNVRESFCGLCGSYHGDKPCYMTQSSENLAQYRLMLLVHAGDESMEERRAAVQVIDETLHRRGMIHLVYGQPLNLVEHPGKHKRPKLDKPLPFALPRRTPALGKLDGHASSAKAAAPSGPAPPVSYNAPLDPPVNRMEREKTGTVNLPLPRISSISQAVAGPSKRPLSPVISRESPKAKKARAGDGTGCVVCGGNAHHLVKDCPDVKAGPKRIKKAIRRLEGDSAHTATLNVLRNILIKQQRKALANAATAIELSD